MSDYQRCLQELLEHCYRDYERLRVTMRNSQSQTIAGAGLCGVTAAQYQRLLQKLLETIKDYKRLLETARDLG